MQISCLQPALGQYRMCTTAMHVSNKLFFCSRIQLHSIQILPELLTDGRHGLAINLFTESGWRLFLVKTQDVTNDVTGIIPKYDRVCDGFQR